MFTLKFDTDSPAFDGKNWSLEIARILREVADDFGQGRTLATALVRDGSGNVIGKWTAHHYDN